MAFIQSVCLSSNLVHKYQLRTPILIPKYRTSMIIKPTSIYTHRYLSCKAQQWSISDRTSIHKLDKRHYLNRQAASFPGIFSWEHERKIDEVREWLLEKGQEEENPTDMLVFIDTIQRVGVSHHFRYEIEAILQRYYESMGACAYGLNNLHDVSLSFRLLRQHGHHVSPDVFEFFKDEDGNYNDDIRRDIKGLMELYDAAHLSFEGEHELDKAANFSKEILNENVSNSSPDSSTIGFRLSNPYHMSIEGLPDTYFLKNLINMNERYKSLKELVEMDLDARRLAYQHEVLQLSKWWKELEIASELDLLRDQPVKWYTWSMTALVDDIGLSGQRIGIAKSIALIYLIDDIFDIYGTLDELKIFTQAVNKWDYAATDTLPDYMKSCYKALLDTTNEIAYNIHENFGHNPVNALKSTWISLCDAFLVEAEWFASGKLPTAEEYLENGKVSSGVYVVPTQLFYQLGLGGTNSSAVNINEITELVSAAAMILRLWDDIGNAMDENQEGIDGSYIEVYMEENKGATVAQAREHAKKLIESAWKRLNKECFFNLSHGSALPFKKACLNMARMIPLTYNADDDQRLPVIQEYVYSMLFNQTSLD